jgi:hypothetical protein
MDQLEEYNYFSSTVYAIKKPEFLDPIRQLTKEYLEKSKENKNNPMTTMTGDYSNEPLAADFGQYISQTVWNILDAQGYAMEHFITYFMEMWTQEHNLHSNMEQHVHGNGAQISVFYFLDVPEGGCKMIIYDPRPAKVITNLPMKEVQEVLPASQNVVFTPEVGTMIFTPAWLPHSFTRNLNKNDSVRFVHMNLSVAPAPAPEADVEVI